MHLEFCTLAVGSGWNELAQATFCQGLNPEILSESPQNIRISKYYSAKPRPVVGHRTVPLTAIELSRTAPLQPNLFTFPSRATSDDGIYSRSTETGVHSPFHISCISWILCC